MPTQTPTLCGTINEYQPKCGDALRLGSKDRMAHSIRGWQVNLCDPSLTRVILNALQVIILTNRRYTNVLF